MGLCASDHPDVPGMRGLHLFHFMLSNCSQRVRLGLEEKGLAWTSHHLNLAANEHVTSDYQRINPKGVVPTLVHDGQVVIESNDIIRPRGGLLSAMRSSSSERQSGILYSCR